MSFHDPLEGTETKMYRPRFHGLPGAILMHQQARDVLPPQKLCSLLGTENKGDFRRHFGLLAPVGHDRDRPEIALGRQPGARID